MTNGQQNCQDALYLALEGTSRSTMAPGPIHDPRPTLIPGKIDTLIPVLTPSPRKAPSFFLPLLTQDPRTFDLMSASSNLRFAVIVPAPSEQSSPIILSPTYERCGILVFLITMLFFTSHPAPTFTSSPRVEYGRK